MAPQISDFIPGSLEDKDKYVEFAYGHHVPETKKGKRVLVVSSLEFHSIKKGILFRYATNVR